MCHCERQEYITLELRMQSEEQTLFVESGKREALGMVQRAAAKCNGPGTAYFGPMSHA